MTLLEETREKSGSNLNFQDSNIKPGMLVGFSSSSSSDITPPFIIARVGRLGLENFEDSAKLYEETLRKISEVSFNQSGKMLLIPSGGAPGVFSLLHVKKPVRELWSPHYDEHDEKPIVKKVDPYTFIFDSAYFGRKNVIRALRERENLGLGYYASFLESPWGRMTVLGR